MLNKFASQMSPQAIRNVKIAAVVVGAVAGVMVVGVVLYKAGVIGTNPELLEEIVETAAASAA